MISKAKSPSLISKTASKKTDEQSTQPNLSFMDGENSFLN